MTANDPIYVTRENQQEADSIAALQAALRPWRLTPVDGRDDVGRDGVIQVHDQLNDGRARAQATPSAFFVQVRSHAAPFDVVHSETIDTRHLHMWSARTAPCTVLFVWSRSSSAFRCRTARELRREADHLRTGWMNQGTVTFDFRREHTFNDLEALRRRIDDESDREGGVSAFHAARRRIVMTEVIADGMPTGFTVHFGAGKEGAASGVLYLGPWWQGEDLDPAEVDGLGVLASAVLLYEEVWVPLTLVNAVLRLLGPVLFQSLLESERLRIWTIERIGFVHATDLRADRWGTLVSLQAGGISEPPTVLPPDQDLAEWTQRIADEQHLPALGPVILRAVRPIAGGMARVNSLLRESNDDLKNPVYRRLLGITEHSEKIPVWDAILANRLLHLNSAMLAAEELRADVVEYEGGLSRLASEKYFSQLRLDRLYPTAKALDAVLRAGGLADVGALVRTIGRERFFAEVDSTAAREFRDWFWESAGSLVGSGADMRSQFASAVTRVLPVDARAVGVLNRLKLRFFQDADGDTVVGAPLAQAPITGFAARVSKADELLKRQALNHFARRQKQIAKFLGRAPDTYESCPCGSTAKFRFCCGKRPD